MYIIKHLKITFFFFQCIYTCVKVLGAILFTRSRLFHAETRRGCPCAVLFTLTEHQTVFVDIIAEKESSL